MKAWGRSVEYLSFYVASTIRRLVMARSDRSSVTPNAGSVRQGDLHGLVTATLRDDRQLRERMSANARSLFQERFDKHIAIAAWRSLFASLTPRA